MNDLVVSLSSFRAGFADDVKEQDYSAAKWMVMPSEEWTAS